MSLTGFQLEGLHLLGYSKRESEFLFLVATHSGYFTNSQFKSFVQSESGSVSHAFIRKLLERKHAILGYSKRFQSSTLSTSPQRAACSALPSPNFGT
jgi:hypothetical protein